MEKIFKLRNNQRSQKKTLLSEKKLKMKTILEFIANNAHDSQLNMLYFLFGLFPRIEMAPNEKQLIMLRIYLNWRFIIKIREFS